MKGYLLLIATILGAVATVSNATCYDYKPDGLCSNFIDGYKVTQSMTDTNTYADATEFLTAGETSIGLLTVLNRVSTYECINAISPFMCQGTYWKCIEGTDGAMVAKVPPCKSTCELAVQECGAFLASVGRGHMLNSTHCAQLPDPPSCVEVAEEMVGKQVPYSCPGKLVKSPYPGQTGCYPECPSPLFTDEDWEDAILMMKILSPISMLCTLIVMLTWLRFPIRRRHPSFMVGWFSFSTFLMATATCISGYGARDVWCTSEGLPANPIFGQNAACTFQGALLCFGSVSGGGWWLAISFQVYLTVVKGKRVNTTQPYAKWYNILVWGISTLLTLIPLAANEIFYEPGHPWCFISNSDHRRWVYGCFYGWVGGMVVAGFYLLVHVCISIYKISKRQGTTKYASVARTLAFLVLLIMIYSYAVAYRLDGSVKEDALYDSVVKWVTCTATGPAAPGEVPDCEFETRPNYSIWIVLIFLLSSVGWTIGSMQGLTMENYVLWRARRMSRIGSRDVEMRFVPQQWEEDAAKHHGDGGGADDAGQELTARA